jgi:SAM-dependent methyltransferase
MTTPSTSPRDAYQEQGFYLHPEPIVPTSLVARARERLGAVVNEEYDTRVPPWRRWNVGDSRRMQKIDQVHLCDEAFHALVAHPAIGELVARVTGADLVQVWATQLLIKPPQGEDLGVIGWHTDAMNWPFWEGEVLTVWLGLDDVAADAGPLIYVTGSHRWPRAEKEGDAYLQDLDGLEERIKVRGPARPWQKVPVLVQAGGVGIHAPHTLHGSGANRSNVSRIGLGINVRTQGARRRAGVEDYGYASYLHHPFVCPILHGPRSPPQVSSSSRDAGPAVGHGAQPLAQPGAGAAVDADAGAVARRLAFLMPHLREGTRLLDAGCGPGSLALRLAERVAPATVTGIDIDARAVATAHASAQRAGLTNARFLVADVLHLLFEDGAFGAVFCHDLLAYLSSPEAAVRELFRVCAPGGLVGAREPLGFSGRLFSVSMNGAERSLSDLVCEMSRLGFGRPNVGVELKGMLHAAGFRAIRATVTQDVYQDQADLFSLRGWLAPFLSGEPGARAVSAGLVTGAALAELAAKVQDWPSDPAAIGVMSWIEYVARKPEADGP